MWHLVKFLNQAAKVTSCFSVLTKSASVRAKAIALVLLIPCISSASDFYSYRLIAFTGGPGLFTGIDSEVSINDKGTVAFVGLVPGGQAIYVGNDTFLRNITPSDVRANVSFTPVVMINNSDQVVGRKLVAGSAGVPPHAFLRVWDASGSATDSFYTVTSAGFPGELFATVQNRASINNTGNVVFVGSPPSAPTSFQIATETAFQNIFNLSTVLQIPLRPRITDNGQVVVRAGGNSLAPILLYDHALSSPQPIATPPIFSALGRGPGISDNGQIVTFYGDLSAAGATSLGTTSGPGIFASVDMGTGSRRIVRIAGAPSDGFTFDPDSLVAVNSTQAFQRAVTIVYIATDTATGQKGIYSSRLNFFGANAGASFNAATPSEFSVGQPTLVIAQGETIPGLADPVQSFNIFDPVNSHDRGEIAFWVQTTTGQQAVIRAHYQEVVFLDFDPVASFSLDPLPNALFSAMYGMGSGPVPVGWAGSMASTLAGFAPARADLTNTNAIQDQIVNIVQGMFDDIDQATPGNQGIKVKVLGRVGDSIPTDGPYMHVFIGDGPYSAANRNTTTGIAPGDIFNQNKARNCDAATGVCNYVFVKETPLIFIDNIFRLTSGYFRNALGNAVSLNQTTGSGTISTADVERAIASTIAHESGHALGLRHLERYKNDLLMNATIDNAEICSDSNQNGSCDNGEFIDANGNGVWDLAGVDEMRLLPSFGNTPIQLVPPEPFTDSNGNDLWDAERCVDSDHDGYYETFIDTNSNGNWDRENFTDVDGNNCNYSENFSFGDLENSGARLAFAVGSEVDEITLHRDQPSLKVQAQDTGFEVNFRASLTIPVNVVRAVLGIVPNGLDHAMPELVDLGSGDLETLLNNSSVEIRKGDKVFVVASTTGSGIDILSVAHGFFGNVSTIDLSNALLIMTEERIRGNLADASGLPFTTALDLFQTTDGSPILIATMGLNNGTSVTVPNVVSQTQAAAQTAITGAGLTVGTVTQQNSATVPSGSVISQNPAAGTSVAAGSAVALVVSSGPAPVNVPNVVGQTQAAAQAAITGAGLTVGTVTQQNSATVPSGSVISQNPAAGASVAVSSSVALVVSSGPAPVIPGDLNGDGVVNCADLAIVKTSFGKRTGQAGFDMRADVNKDGVVDVRDLSFVSRQLPAGTKCS